MRAAIAAARRQPGDRPGGPEERLREEIAEHIALQTKENLRAGAAPSHFEVWRLGGVHLEAALGRAVNIPKIPVTDRIAPIIKPYLGRLGGIGHEICEAIFRAAFEPDGSAGAVREAEGRDRRAYRAANRGKYSRWFIARRSETAGSA